MPELPEVEHAVRGLRRALAGRRITSVRAHHRAQARTLGPAVQRRVAGRRVVGVTRRGKHQLIHLDDGATLLVHFRLDGEWAVTRAATALPRFARVSLDLAGGRRISLLDPRALCTITWHAPGKPPALALGPEADDPAVTAAWLHAQFATRRGPVKPVLLDQRLLAGIGNIYAQEACWRAAIHPAVRANALTPRRVAALLRGIRAALRDGHRHVGRYRDGTREVPWKVYDREGEPCARCGASIRRMVQAGRGTWYCAGCQLR